MSIVASVGVGSILIFQVWSRPLTNGDQNSITPIANSLGIASFDFHQCKLKPRRCIKHCQSNNSRQAQGALQCKALFREAEEEFEIIGLQLVKVEQEGGELVNKENSVHFQLHSMKERSCMSFQPIPIMHPVKLPTYDIKAKTFIIIKPCGYCKQCFHCHDIAITCCIHFTLFASMPC